MTHEQREEEARLIRIYEMTSEICRHVNLICNTTDKIKIAVNAAGIDALAKDILRETPRLPNAVDD